MESRRITECIFIDIPFLVIHAIYAHSIPEVPGTRYRVKGDSVVVTTIVRCLIFYSEGFLTSESIDVRASYRLLIEPTAATRRMRKMKETIDLSLLPNEWYYCLTI